MPQPFNNAVMTNAGAQLLTRAQAGEILIEFTRMAIGNGEYTEEEKTLASLQERRELKSLKNSYPLSSISIFSEHSVKITSLITNYDPVGEKIIVTEGYYINEIGLFAKPKGEEDDVEVLYSIAVTSGDKGDFMPLYNGHSPAQIMQDYYATVSNSAEVTINSNGAAASADDVIDLRKKVEDLNDSLASLSHGLTVVRLTKTFDIAANGDVTVTIPFTPPEGKKAIAAIFVDAGTKVIFCSSIYISGNNVVMTIKSYWPYNSGGCIAKADVLFQ